MTTLEQKLEDRQNQNHIETGDFFITEDQIIQVFKKWLQQKRREKILAIAKRKKNIISLEERSIIDCFFDELLEELKWNQ